MTHAKQIPLHSESEILLMLLDAIKDLRDEIRSTSLTSCKADYACDMLGTKDKRVLTYFHEKGALNRSGGKKSGYLYDKGELMSLAHKIRTGEIKMPKL